MNETEICYYDTPDLTNDGNYHTNLNAPYTSIVEDDIIEYWLKENVDMTKEELIKFVEKYAPERTI